MADLVEIEFEKLRKFNILIADFYRNEKMNR